jgi:hypothetical protein
MKTDVLSETKVSAELTAEEKKAISKEIELVVRNFMDEKTLSYETYIELRANKEGYVMSGEGEIIASSYDDFTKYMKTAFQSVQRFTEFEILSMYIYVLCRDAASCTTLFQSKYLTTSDETIVNNGCWTFVFKKFDGEWKVIQENGTHTK